MMKKINLNDNVTNLKSYLPKLRILIKAIVIHFIKRDPRSRSSMFPSQQNHINIYSNLLLF